MIRFSDDAALVAESEQNLKRVMKKMKEVMSNECTIRINKAKTIVYYRD